ncbi:MAG: rhomboid family intramembrane serine protease [Rhizobiaceae bacterium]|nr:rhomboid family intramembrane serine protease [Rhizobiaceae bacterium]
MSTGPINTESSGLGPQRLNGEGFPPERKRPVPPMLNVPPIMTAFIGLLVLIHGIREYFLSPEQNLHSIIAFAFIPARYAANALELPYPLADWWSPITYALLHGDWGHVAMNAIWMLAFGAIVARRIGPIRFILFGALTAIGGAALHYVFHMEDLVPVIGASAIVSGFMGAAARFAFGRFGQGVDMTKVRMLSLVETFTNRQVVTFLALWFGLNLLFGSGIIDIGGEGQGIAWQAHIGGFVTGLFGFSFFDRHKFPQG